MCFRFHWTLPGKVCKVQEDTQKRTILFIAKVDEWINIVIQISTGNEINDRQCQRLRTDQHTQISLEVVYQLLDTLRCLVRFWDPDALNTVQERSMEQLTNGTVPFLK